MRTWIHQTTVCRTNLRNYLQSNHCEGREHSRPVLQDLRQPDPNRAFQTRQLKMVGHLLCTIPLWSHIFEDVMFNKDRRQLTSSYGYSLQTLYKIQGIHGKRKDGHLQTGPGNLDVDSTCPIDKKSTNFI